MDGPADIRQYAPEPPLGRSDLKFPLICWKVLEDRQPDVTAVILSCFSEEVQEWPGDAAQRCGFEQAAVEDCRTNVEEDL